MFIAATLFVAFRFGAVGLVQQGELNIDVLDHDACEKLAKWFEDRWQDRWCIDISDELEQIIQESCRR